MTVRDVVTYPDRFLKRPSASVPSIGADERRLADDLVETMYASPGCVGLAAPQIGVALRAFAMDVSVMKKPPADHHGLVVMFDPELTPGTDTEVRREGCLSVPDYTCDVARALDVTVRGTTPDGEAIEIETSGFEARALQHEIDHLDGLLILDRVASARTDVHRRQRYADPGKHLR